jgi:hypothetical protein
MKFILVPAAKSSGDLGAAVQHDDQGNRSPLLITAGDEEPVGTASRLVAVGPFDEPCALRHDVPYGRRGALDPISQRKSGAHLRAVKQRASMGARSMDGWAGRSRCELSGSSTGSATVAVKLFGMGIASRHHRRALGDTDVKREGIITIHPLLGD